MSEKIRNRFQFVSTKSTVPKKKTDFTVPVSAGTPIQTSLATGHCNKTSGCEQMCLQKKQGDTFNDANTGSHLKNMKSHSLLTGQKLLASLSWSRWRAGQTSAASRVCVDLPAPRTGCRWTWWRGCWPGKRSGLAPSSCHRNQTPTNGWSWPNSEQKQTAEGG